ncbi:hypothetical protein [Methanobacterium alcaliphilum]|uniref:hypothetical protein n=1 Tax=Methanobacterium alcaliphilum TaxID=392018 RepID=UPI00200B58F1|nr:hypothetical protein [Methanobacterium alcaliphilum]MCK9151834.1 hypothetical protein [Methanobacterium alcaliphilum]
MSSSHDFTVMGFVFLGLIMGTIFLFVEDILVRKLENFLNFKIKKNNCKAMGCYTYEGLPWILLMYVFIVLIVLFYPFIIHYHNLPVYIGILFITLYPLLVIIIRKDTFNDSSVPSAKNPVYIGSNRVSGGPGYNPMYYFLFSFAIGGASTIWGFSMLNFPNIPLNIGLSKIIFGLLAQTVILFPDKFNKILPSDTRTKKGLYYINIITIILIIILITYPT